MTGVSCANTRPNFIACAAAIATLETLRGFSPSQLRELSDGHGMINAVCDFCRTRYQFALDDLL